LEAIYCVCFYVNIFEYLIVSFNIFHDQVKLVHAQDEMDLHGFNINPYSIYVTDTWKLKIFLFGSQFYHTYNQAERVRYTAPEILGGTELKDFGCLTDSYQWGFVFYELLTKHKPYEDQYDPDSLRDMILEGEKFNIPDYVCPFIADMIRRCWSNDIHNRPELKDIIEIKNNENKKMKIISNQKYLKRTINILYPIGYQSFGLRYLMMRHYLIGKILLKIFVELLDLRSM